MIKLIASDMDGTLLTPDKQLPPGFAAMVRELHARGVLFTVCSGRTFSTLQQHFSGLVNKMEFICDNGAFVVEHGKEAFVSIMAHEAVLRAAALVDGLGENVRAVLCGQNGIYTHEYRQNLRLRKSMESSFSTFTPCADFSAVKDNIFKIAVCDVDGAAHRTLPVLRTMLGETLQVTQSGPLYVDIMNGGISKGAALAHLQRTRGILPQETMAFGDYFNDVDMLACAHYSFVMENAAPEMFCYGRYRAPSNAAHGVMQIIRRHVLENVPLPLADGDAQEESFVL